MEGLNIISKNDKNGLYRVSYPKNPTDGVSDIPTAGAGTTTTTSGGGYTWKSIQVGQAIPGKVVSHSTLAATIQIGGLRGRLHATNISDDYSSVIFSQEGGGPLSIGDEVNTVVLKVNPHARIMELSIRPSRVQGPSKSGVIKDGEINNIGELEVGGLVRGFVKNIAGGGVFVALGATVTARVMIKELFDDVSLFGSSYVERE